MPLTTAAIRTAATYAMPVDGAATTIRSLGSTLGQNTLFFDDGAAMTLQKVMVVSNKSPVPLASAPNGYTQQRSKVFAKFPKLLANGKYTVNTVLIEIACDPETTAAERDRLREVASVVGAHPNFDDLITNGSTAS